MTGKAAKQLVAKLHSEQVGKLRPFSWINRGNISSKVKHKGRKGRHTSRGRDKEWMDRDTTP